MQGTLWVQSNMFVFFFDWHTKAEKRFELLPLSFGSIGWAVLSMWRLAISCSNRGAEVVFLTCSDKSVSFSVVFSFHLLFPGYVLDKVNMFMCRTLAPLLPHKWRRLLQPEVAHRRYGLHFSLLIFILLAWQVCVFAQLSFFQRTLYLPRRKTGGAKQASMLNILLSQISSLQ